jgi:hypothetical protein
VDANLNPVKNAAAFVDPAIPPGFAPFNIQGISDKVILITYARQDTANAMMYRVRETGTLQRSTKMETC